jgi:hypothetical protein
MNRKKAILSIVVAGGGIVAAWSGYKWVRMNRVPDLAYLDNHKTMIADLAETIIPRTDTPGAKDALVHESIIDMIKTGSDRKTQNSFLDGLKDVEEYTGDHYSKSFSHLSTADQQNVLKHFQMKGKNFSGLAGKVKNKVLGKSFFTILKEYTTIAYCTSKPGATQGLAYEFIPGRYLPCTPLAANQKAWATK